MAIDPICKMEVEEKTAKYKTEHMGKTFYFCAPGCKVTFEKNPMKYMDGNSGHSMKSSH